MADFFNAFHFLRPWWLLALLPGVVLWRQLCKSVDPLGMYQGLIAPHLLKHLVMGENRRGLVQPVHLFLLIWVLLAVALAGPSWRVIPTPFAQQQTGLMVLLKTSRSMENQDVAPSRMERAVYKLRDLLALRGEEPSGLIAYSGSAHLVMPLTRDTRIIELMAGELSPAVMPRDGDSLAAALELARQQFERSQSVGSILVIADSIDPAQAAQLGQYRETAGPPVQVLAMAPEPQAARAAVARGAQALDAAIHPLTVNDSDVQAAVAGAKRLVRSVSARQEGTRRKDDGYLLVPFLVVLIALWARRGWSLQWT